LLTKRFSETDELSYYADRYNGLKGV